MPPVLLDTTVLIDALRGRPAAGRIRELRRTTDPPYLSAVNVEELWRGVRPGEETAVRHLVEGLRLAPLNRPQAEQAGIWRRGFAAQGITLTQADCLVAAAAFGIGARLATANVKDFPMHELDVEHWPVGE